jgi:pyruvate/2-oxoglutarate dehydrogenase complex dihydrolipoamide acyltransferase (E2) component
LPKRPAILEADQTIPIRGLQRVMVQSMTQSNAVPTFTLHEELDVEELFKIREELKPVALDQGIKLTFLPFVMKVLIISLQCP